MKKISLLTLVLILMLSLAGCKKQQTVDQTPNDVVDNIDTSNDGDSFGVEDNEGYDAEQGVDNLTGEEASTDNSELSEDNTIDLENKEEVAQEEKKEPVVLVAKTYKQVYPELYNFYPSNPKLTYSKWVYTIDKKSDFIGSIIYPDGTVIVGTGEVSGDISINVDTGDYTQGDKSDGNLTKPSDVEKPSVDEKLQRDSSVNPLGEDLKVSSIDGTDIDVTTKTIANAVIDKSKSSPYILSFSVDSTKYVFETDTVDATMDKLLTKGLYDGLAGSVFINTQKTLVTEKGTYTEYMFKDKENKSSVYAATFVPTYTANTVYLLYSDKLETNSNLLELIQLLIVD